MTHIHWKYRALKMYLKIAKEDPIYHHGLGKLEVTVPDGDKKITFHGGTRIPMKIKKKSAKRWDKTVRYIKNKNETQSMLKKSNDLILKGYAGLCEEKYQAFSNNKNK